MRRIARLEILARSGRQNFKAAEGFAMRATGEDFYPLYYQGVMGKA